MDIQPVFTLDTSVPFSRPDITLAVRHDLFPAEVTFTPAHEAAAITMPKCRVLVTLDAVFVFTDGPRGPSLVFYDRLDDIDGANATGFTFVPSTPAVHDVATVAALPTNRCGCGSRLRGARLFGRISYVPSPAATPTPTPTPTP